MPRMARPDQILNAAQGKLPPPADWQTDAPVPLLRNVLRLTAPNPGVMTGPGTNSYLVGDAATGYTVIDPGPADADHLQRLWQAALHPDGTGGNIKRIVCTHSHPDHAPGAWPLQALCAHRPPVMGLPSAPTARAASAFTPDETLSNQELLTHVLCGLEANFSSFCAASIATTQGYRATLNGAIILAYHLKWRDTVAIPSETRTHATRYAPNRA